METTEAAERKPAARRAFKPRLLLRRSLHLIRSRVSTSGDVGVFKSALTIASLIHEPSEKNGAEIAKHNALMISRSQNIADCEKQMGPEKY